MEKIFVLGIDGATFDLIKPWVKEGKLPNMAEMMTEGAFGELKSTVPTNSAPAWTSFVTGSNPGKHGIFHFISLGNQSKDYLINSNSRACKAIWNLLSENEKKVGIVNVPLTFPPENVNGFMISGMDTPSMNNVFTFPKELRDEITKYVGNYQIEAPLADLVRITSENKRKRFITEVMKTMEMRFKTVKFLMKKYDWDLFLVVFVATDRFQHRFWKFMDPAHPHFNENKACQYKSAIFNVYKRLDEMIGETWKMLDENTSLMIMSDHGFGSAPVRHFNMNNWLSSQNLLTYKQGAFGVKNFKSTILQKLKVHTPIKLRHFIRVKFRSQVSKMWLNSRQDNIDWSATKAYSDQHLEIFSSIWINLKGREPRGIIEPGQQYEDLCTHIVALLNDFRDPETGEQMVNKIYKREDLFKGPHSDKGPDLLVEWKNDAYRTQSAFVSLSDGAGKHFGTLNDEETSQTISGEHKRNGVFLVRGKGIRKGIEIEGANIIDLAPTMLYKLDVSIPREMDGVVLKEIFEEGYLKRKEIKYSQNEHIPVNMATHAFSQEEDMEIKNRLRSLGYLE